MVQEKQLKDETMTVDEPMQMKRKKRQIEHFEKESVNFKCLVAKGFLELVSFS